MRTLRRKLHSKTGSSLIMTMVYFLFCIFVGGSVLAAATANGGRLVSQKASRQDYYTQRSAALLLKEQMQNIPGVQITLTETQVSNLVGGASGSEYYQPEPKTYQINFTKDPASIAQNDFQKLISDAAINLFWEKNNTDASGYQDYFAGTIMQDSNLVEQSNLKKPKGFLNLKIEDTTIPVIPVEYECSYVEGEKDDVQELRFSCKILDGKQKSLFTVSATGSIITDKLRAPSESGGNGDLTITHTQTTIYKVRWANASIQKGGAS